MIHLHHEVPCLEGMLCCIQSPSLSIGIFVELLVPNKQLIKCKFSGKFILVIASRCFDPFLESLAEWIGWIGEVLQLI